METTPSLTPAVIRQRALAARTTINAVTKRAGVSNTTFWLWDAKAKAPGPLVIGKLEDALVWFERDHAERMAR